MEPRPLSGDVSSAAKYRPKQSCLRCRERKVKCDREKPCGACRARGQESECEYNTNNEDRFQISQNEVIGRLRKEINRLKRRLADVDASSPSSEPASYEQRPYPRKALKRTISDSAGTSFMRRANFDSSSPWPLLPTGSISRYDGPVDRPHEPSEIVQAETAQRKVLSVARSHQASSMTPSVSGSSTSQTTLSAEQERGLTEELLGSSLMQPPPNAPFTAEKRSRGSVGDLDNLHPNPWKGKRDLLKHILKAIRESDEGHVRTIIDIVRTSASPEDAIVSINEAMSSNSPVPVAAPPLDFASVPFIPTSLSYVPPSSAVSYTEGLYPAVPFLAHSSATDQQWPSGELHPRRFSS